MQNADHDKDWGIIPKTMMPPSSIKEPLEFEKDAKKVIEDKLNRKVDLRKPSRLSKLAKEKRKQLRIKATTSSRKG